ncbi:MAG: HDIG domain-containing metalloprotein [Promethearchaeati archaeon SRVP18_Atabeyarchaeia-1]
MKRGIPSRESCLRLLRKVGLDSKIIEHSTVVARTSLEIATRMCQNGVSVDTALVEAGALLHDIGRSRVHGIAHGKVGAQMLRELGYPDCLARIAETHVLCGVLADKSDLESESNEEKPVSMKMEEKIVCYADKTTSENGRTTVRERYDKWFRKYGRNSTLTRAFNRTKEIETELNSLISRKQQT